MARHAIRSLQRPQHVYASHERSSPALRRQIPGGVLRRYLNLQPLHRGTSTSSPDGMRQASTREVIRQSSQVLFPVLSGNIPRIHYHTRRDRGRPSQDVRHPSLAHTAVVIRRTKFPWTRTILPTLHPKFQRYRRPPDGSLSARPIRVEYFR